MANKIKIKRTTVSGRTPNTTNSANTQYIEAGELALNLADGKMFSSNGSASFEVGANLTSIIVGSAFTQTSGNANFDSGVLFVDGTNNRVGVNNTTPGHALSVTGTTNLAGAVTGVTTLAAGNTTITGFVNATSSVNAASFTVGATIVANSTAVYATRLNSKTEGNLNVNTALTSGAITVTDTRAAQTTPETLASPLVDFDFKQNTTEGLSDGGTYFGEMSFRPYGTTTDWSGGPSHQLGFTSNSNVYHRSGSNTTWGAWGRLYKEGTVLAAGNTTITGFVNVSSTGTFGGNVAVTGAITATGDITAFFSDDRLKNKLYNIPYPIEKVMSLNGFYYVPNDEAEKLGYEKTLQVGVSAQEVHAILPEVTAPAPIDSKYMTVKYEKLIPLLIEAIKEQQRQIDELKALLIKD